MNGMKNNFWIMRHKEDYECLQEMLKFLGDVSQMTMIEIGSYIGESTTFFAKHFKQVISIDPFQNNYDETDGACNGADFEDVYQEFLKNTKSFQNIEHFRLTSRTASYFLRLIRVDFVYIDGNHLYEYVKNDIKDFLPLIKEGGWIGGHDYTEWHLDVMKAVDEVLGSVDGVFCDGSWIKKV